MPWLIDATSLDGWILFVTVELGVFYTLIRSGWSRRFADAALTKVSDWPHLDLYLTEIGDSRIRPSKGR